MPSPPAVALAVEAALDGAGGVLLPLDGDGAPLGAARAVRDLAPAVVEAERDAGPRWVVADVALAYPPLVRP